MCGIAGIFSYKPEGASPALDPLVAVRDLMRHRGPDAHGLWTSEDRNVAFAHRRLSIIDLSIGGTQPMTSFDSRYTIVFNGEIYNYRELRDRLVSHGYCFQTSSDTEVLLHLYDFAGADMLPQLRGMYAFALWDRRERELIMARDPLGIKPLYFADDGATIWFSSQVRPLVRAAGVTTSEEPAGHVAYFLWGHVPEPYTLFRSIRSLPAGHYCRIKYGGSRVCREHWRMPLGPADERAPQCSRGCTGSARESLRRDLKESVNYHLVADVPIGLFLSAGRDSATLLALASETIPAIHTCTVGFSDFIGTCKDETPLARLAANHYGANHHEFLFSNSDLADASSAFLNAMDQPTVDGFNSFLVSRAAREQGLKVAISGVGADELFGGYSNFTTIPKLVRGARPFAFVPGLGSALRIASATVLPSQWNPKYSSLIEFGGSIAGAYLLRRGMFLPWELPSILDRDLVKAGMQELQTLTQLNKLAGNGHSGCREKLMRLEIGCYLRNQLLRDIDWASMFSSLEVRTPFVDSALFERVFAHARQFGWATKELMASTPAEPLPTAIRNRPKTGFSIPFFDSRQTSRVTSEVPQRTWARHVYHNYVLSLQ